MPYCLKRSFRSDTNVNIDNLFSLIDVQKVRDDRNAKMHFSMFWGELGKTYYLYPTKELAECDKIALGSINDVINSKYCTDQKSAQKFISSNNIVESVEIFEIDNIEDFYNETMGSN